MQPYASCVFIFDQVEAYHTLFSVYVHFAGLECVCQSGYWQTFESAAGQLSCVSCPPEHVSTEDGLDCIRCESPLAYDPATKTCTECPAGSLQGEETINNGNFLG